MGSGRISALGLFITDLAALDPYCQDLGPIFSQYGPRTWLIRYIYFLVCDGCNETFQADKGGFHSPNYPQQYPDNQFCSWRITVSPSNQVYLQFSNFTLQAENNTDAVYVYDGDNETGEVLGVFYGSDPRSIYSSSNSLLVIFKSDNNSSYTGFQAVYHAINCSGKLPYAVFFGYNFTRSSNVYCISVIFSNRVLKSKGLNK